MNDQISECGVWNGPHFERYVAYGGTSTTLTEETAAWLVAQPGMADITASRKTLLQRTPTSDDEDG